MAMRRTDPTFTACQDDVGRGWHVVVRWQSGEAEEIGGFFSQGSAMLWIEEDAERWIMRRYGGPPPSAGGRHRSAR